VLVPSDDKKMLPEHRSKKKVNIAIAQGVVAVLDGRDYIRLYENVWFVIAITLVFWNKVKVKFALEQATQAQRGSRGIDLLFL